DELAHAWATRVVPLASSLRGAMDAFIVHKGEVYASAKAAASRTHQRALIASYSIALLALLAGAFCGGFLPPSRPPTLRLEARARAAAEKERAFFIALLNHLPIGIVAVEAPSGRILYVTNPARELLSRVDPRLTEVQSVGEYAAWRVHRMDGSAYAADELP